MLLDKADQAAFKRWVTPKLEHMSVSPAPCSTNPVLTRHSSDADPEVLSDYVFEMLAHETSPQSAKQAARTQLADFLNEGRSKHAITRRQS